MTDYHSAFSIELLTDALLTELLETFAHQRGWTDITHYRQAAAEIIDRQLTVEFRTFILRQISY